MIRFTNNHLNLELISIHHTDINNPNLNTAIVRRLKADDTTIDYVVVRNLELKEDKTGEWGHAVQYCIPSLTDATKVFVDCIS